MWFNPLGLVLLGLVRLGNADHETELWTTGLTTAVFDENQRRGVINVIFTPKTIIYFC
jgi:hypothetical protein